MNKRLIRLLTLLFIVLFEFTALTLKAQGNLTLTGSVVDNSNNTPVELATVKLISSEDPNNIKSLQTDSAGKFTIKGLKKGIYSINISYLGYKILDKAGIELTGVTSVHNIGVLRLVPNLNQLGEVQVKAEKQLVSNKPGKMEINAQSKIFASSNTAFDVLQKAPGVALLNGSFKINGNVEPDILLNGRRTPLSLEELKSIPYDNIEKIEIISNPNSSYEGDRKAIINIVLKNKVKETGYNTSLYTEYARNKYNQFNFGGDFSFKQKKFTITASAGRIWTPAFTDITGNRYYNQDGQDYLLNTKSFIKNKPTLVYYNAGLEYYIDTANTFGVYYRGNTLKTTQEPNSVSKTFLGSTADDNQLVSLINTTGLTKTDATNSTYTVNYEHAFNKGTKFSLESNLGRYDLTQNQNTISSNVNTPTNTSGIINDARSTIDLFNVNADFSTALSKAVTLQLGGKFNNSTTKDGLVSDSVRNNAVINAARQTNDFKYDEKIYAYYFNLDYDFGFATLEVGTRVEDTRSTGTAAIASQSFTKNYTNVLPGAQLYKKWGSGQTLTLSYAKKISRPSYRDLNPFVFIIDPYTYVSGNPFLNPSTYNNFKIEYSIHSVNMSLSYRTQKNIITQLPVLNSETNILTYSPLNLDKKRNISFDLNFPLKVASWWTLENSSTVLHDHYESQLSGGSFTRNKINFTNNFVSTFTISPGFYFNTSFFYTSPSVFNFYQVNALSSLDLGLKKELLKKKLTIDVNYYDIYRGRKDVLTVNYLNLHNSLSQFTNTRYFNFRLTYSFGNQSINGNLKNEPKATEEGDRVKNGLNQ